MKIENRWISVNGQCIEDVITEYTTLSVSGREALPVDLNTVKIATRHGSLFRSRRFDSKKLVITYVIFCSGLEEMQVVYTRMKHYFSDTECKFIFGDEPDMYWIGTPEVKEPKYKGMDAAKGTITIYLSDPHKYSVIEHEVEFENGFAEIYYNGTVEGKPVFEASFPATNGFISFTKDNETIVIGNQYDEGEGETPAEPDPDVLIENTFDTSVPTGTEWAVNESFTGSDSHYVGGTLGISSAPAGLYPTAFSTNNGKWHGPTIVRHLSGSKTECTLNYSHSYQVTANSQCGAFRAALASATGEVAAISYYKTGTGSKNGEYSLVVNGTVKKTVSCSYAANNAISGNGVSSISKVGSVFTFNVSGNVYQFTDESMTNVAVTRICFYFAQWKTSTVANRNRLYSFRFTSPDEGTSGTVIEHTFHENDVLEADTESAEIKLNNIPNYNLGNIDNPWESFALKHGYNTITVDSSEWASSDPTVTLRYREVYR